MAGSHDSFLALGGIDRAALSRTETVHQRVTALYGAHREQIYRFLVGQGLPADTAQEVTQDVFVDLFVALQRGTDVKSEQGWLYTVAGRAAVDYWRRERRQVWVESDSNPIAEEAMPSKEASPESRTAERERLRHIAQGLRRLPKEQRLCIHLRMRGLRYREIAKILGVSTSTAAEWISTAVERLRGGAHD